MNSQSISSQKPRAKRGTAQKPKQGITVFDYLLCRILAWGAAGFDVTQDIENARTLAGLLKEGA